MRYLILATGVSLFLAATAAAQPERRNVVLLIADDLGRTLGCYGDKAAKTPHLDALAAAGTRFTHGFASVASCSPSRSTIFTGMHTHHNGQYGLAHATHNAHTFRTVQSLPKLLGAAGYRTGIIGKLHVLPKEVYPWDEEVGGGRNVPTMAQKAFEFIRESKDRPFFLVMGYTDPHRAGKGFGNEKPPPDVPRVSYDPKTLPLPYHLPDQPDARDDLADYYTSVSRLDHGIGLMAKVLKETGRDRDTLVIFLSDNGIPFPGAKTTLYDSGIHLPLIVKAPGRKPHVSDAMASWIDVAPTVLAWAGVKQPTAMHGRSLLPVLDTKADGWNEVYGSHQFHEITMYYPIRMVRTRTHKYLLNLAHPLPFPFASDIFNSPTWQGILGRGDGLLGKRTVAQFVQRPKEELYDLTTDPDELTNLAGNARAADVLADLRKRVRTWQEKTSDPWLIKYRHE